MIHKIGYSWGTPYDEAIADAVSKVEAMPNDHDPIWEKGICWTTETEGIQYLVKIVTRAD